MSDRPLSDDDKRQLRLIIGDVPDLVARSNAWCARNGAEVTFSDGRYTCLRDGEVLATARNLGVLVAKLERLAP